MRRSILLTVSAVLLFFVIVPAAASGATLYVGPGETYTEIQPAIDAAVAGDTVIVRDGTYTGTNNKNLDFKGKGITLRSENGAATCIIDCEGSGRGFYFNNGESSTSVVDGFTITNGGDGTYHGGGIYCFNASPTITNCIITGNSADWGGGIYYNSRTPILTNCIISGNTAVERGGGIYSSSADPIIENCIFSDNMVTAGSGGAILGWYASPTIKHCTFSGNSASGKGGALCFWMDSSTNVTNCILWNDSASVGQEIALEYGYAPSQVSLTAVYSDIEGGTAAAYVDYSGSFNWGSGNINADPLFVGGGDYHLTSASPCVDTGTDAGVYRDIDGDTRPEGSGFEMGADEVVALADADGDGFTTDLDCDDNDSSVFPGAPELCDGKDNDCDGVTPADEVDADADGFMICDGDCDDADAGINPDAYEIPGDIVDDNCDGSLGACDPGADWKNHGQFVRCVAHETDALIEAGYLTQEEGDELISSAAQSDIGKK